MLSLGQQLSPPLSSFTSLRDLPGIEQLIVLSLRGQWHMGCLMPGSQEPSQALSVLGSLAQVGRIKSSWLSWRISFSQDSRIGFHTEITHSDISYVTS